MGSGPTNFVSLPGASRYCSSRDDNRPGVKNDFCGIVRRAPLPAGARRRNFMTEYVTELIARVKTKNPAEPEFHQAVQEVAESLTLVLERHPEYVKAKILERMIEPERVIMFRVPWQDDKGEIRINRGFRINMNSAIGPYKGDCVSIPRSISAFSNSSPSSRSSRMPSRLCRMGAARAAPTSIPRARATTK